VSEFPHEIEAMVRAAGGFLEVSPDLRPRTLEQARVRSRRRKLRRHLACAFLGLVLLGQLAGEATRRHWRQTPLRRAGTFVSSDEFLAIAQAKARAGRYRYDVGWGLVEAYTELRDRQSRLITHSF
jgi:hypothetical protein